MSAPMAKANGIEETTYPEYSSGGWNIMLGCRSSGLSPAPSTGGFATCVNGLTLKTSRAQKNDASAPRTAVAQGTTSRWRWRFTTSTAAEKSDSSHTHRSSEPDWLDHMAVSL